MIRAALVALALAACGHGDGPAPQPPAAAPPPGDGLTGQGATADEVQHRPGADLDQQIEDVKRAGAQVGDGRGERGRAAPPAPEPSHIDDECRDGRLAITDVQALDESSLAIDKVRNKIMQAYVAGLKRCYREALCRVDPHEHGTVSLQFDVTESGRVDQAKVAGFDETMSACIQSRVVSWRFDAPKDRDGTSTTVALRVTLELTSE